MKPTWLSTNLPNDVIITHQQLRNSKWPIPILHPTSITLTKQPWTKRPVHTILNPCSRSWTPGWKAVSKLVFYGRPLIVFDASNREHRQFYFQFIETGAWGRCPYRFIVPDDQGDLITMIQRKLITFYLNKEFKKWLTNIWHRCIMVARLKINPNFITWIGT